MRCTDLSNLKRDKNNRICWKQSVGATIPFKYDDMSGVLTIVAVSTGKHRESVLDISYDDRITTSVPASSIKNCILGRVLETRYFGFVTRIGDRFVDSRRDYTIIAQRRGTIKSNNKYTQREVEILCNKCNTKTWMAEERVLPPKNCACNNCRYSPMSGKKSIVETDPWMIPFFPNGYDEAKQHTRGQGIKIYFVCPYCNTPREKAVAISTLSRTHSIGCACSWSVGRSFPHRLIKSVLDCLHVKYIQEANGNDLEWALDFSYDFYLPDFGVIIEAHGKQHYETGTGYYKNTLAQTQENDARKQDLALANGISESKYVVIDCRKSETEYIKNNVLNSCLPAVLGIDFSGLDWLSLTQIAWKSEKLSILEYSRDNPKLSVREISDTFGVSRDLVKEVQVNAGIYDVSKEKTLGIKKQQDLQHVRTQKRDGEICRLKVEYPSFSTSDIAKITGMDRHSICRILKREGLYDPELEKRNRYSNISSTRKKSRESDYDIICKYKVDFPDISARKVGCFTGHTHGYIIKVWRENNLY